MFVAGNPKSGRETSQSKENMIDDRSRSNRDFDHPHRGRGDSAGSRHSSSRDRDRDRNNRDMRDRDRRRDNSRDRRDNRDRIDRDRRDGRDRRDRERWNERDNRDRRSRDRDSERSDNNKRNKPGEKSLSERLQEMANENFQGRRLGDDRNVMDMHTEDSKPEFPFQRSPKEHEENRDPRSHNEFENRRMGMIPPNSRNPPFMPPHEDMGGERFERFGPGGGAPPAFDRRDGPPVFDRRSNDGFDNRMRGGIQGMQSEFFGPPGFNRGPPMQMMRPDGPPMHGFGPRGPLMGGPRGPPPPHLFQQRGGPRGPRPGIPGKTFFLKFCI